MCIYWLKTQFAFPRSLSLYLSMFVTRLDWSIIAYQCLNMKKRYVVANTNTWRCTIAFCLKWQSVVAVSKVIFPSVSFRRTLSGSVSGSGSSYSGSSSRSRSSSNSLSHSRSGSRKSRCLLLYTYIYIFKSIILFF